MKTKSAHHLLTFGFIKRGVSLFLSAAMMVTSSPAIGAQAQSSIRAVSQTVPAAPQNITLGKSYIRPGYTTTIKWSGMSGVSLSRYEYRLVFCGGGKYEVAQMRSHTLLTKNSSGNYFIKMESSNGKELPEGYYAVYLRGVDSCGNAGKEGKAMIYLDRTAPARPSISLKGADEVNYHCALPVIQWNGATDNKGLYSMVFGLNSRYAEIGSVSASGTYTFSPKDGIKDGKNDIYMLVRDQAGNSASSNMITYYYDGEAPTLTLGAVTPASTKNQPGTCSPKVTYEAKDNHGLGQLQYSLDGINYSSVSAGSSGTLSFPPQWFMGSGTYTLYIRVTDKAGNISDVHTCTYYFSDLSQDYLPGYVTARENMNGTTVITWEKKYTDRLPEGASYSLYGSPDKGFTPGEGNLIQSGIHTNHYTVAEKEHQGIRYYKLCAVRKQDGKEISRKYTGEIYSTHVEQTERDKKAGECSYGGTEAVSLPGGSASVRKDSGNLTYTAEGLTLPALHFHIPVTPVYNSSRNYEGMLGKAWMLPQERQLWQEENGYFYMDGMGAVHRFAEGENGSVSPGLIGKTITKQTGHFKTKRGETSIGYWYVMESSQGKEYYSKEGRLVLEVENDGAYLLYQYNENDGTLSEIITATGRKARFHYDEKERLSGKNRLVSVTYTSSDGNLCAETLSFKYSEGMLESIVHTGTDGSTKAVHAYDYENGFLSGITSPGGKRAEILYTDGKVSRVTDIRGDRVDFSYQTDSNTLMAGSTVTTYSDETGKLTSTGKATFDAEGRLAEETDRQGLTTAYTYGKGLNCYQIASVAAEREYQVLTSAGKVETRKVTKTTETIYNADGNVAEEREENGGTATYEYGDSDNPSQPTKIQETTGEGDISTETMTYDERGNLITDKTVSEGETTVTRNEYDGEDSHGDDGEYIEDNIIEETGSSTTIQGQDSRSSRNVYDGEGNMTEETILSGTTEETTSTKYDDMGRVASEESQTEGTKTSYTYDALGRTIKTTVTYTKGEQKGKTETEEKAYDAEGNVITETARDGVITTYRYDRKNRVISETVSKGESRTSRYTYSTQDITLYGGKGIQKTISVAVKTVKNDQGDITDITYTDAQGRTVRTYSGGIYTDTWYDRSGHAIATCVLGTALPEDDSEDTILENSRVSLELYDADGNATHSVVQPAINEETYYVDGDSLKTVSQYDMDGNVISQTDAMGCTTKYTYKNSQLVGVVKADGTEGNTYQYSQIYDGDTVALTDITGADGRAQKPLADITVNSRGKVSRTITNAAGQTLAIEDEADGKKIATRYEYDDQGNKIKEIYGTGAVLAFQYDTKGQVTAEKSYDAKGNQTGETAYTYDSNGNVMEMADFMVENGKKRVLRTTLSEYDCFQRLVTYTEMAGNESTSSHKQKNQISYAYDTSDMLVEVSYQETDGITGMKYGYNAYGWLTRVTVKRADGQEIVLRKYTYDSHGKVSSMVDTVDFLGAAAHTLRKAYLYDQYDRATGITVTDGETGQVVQSERYAYDKNGNITRKTERSSYAESAIDRVTEYKYNSLGELVESSRTDYGTEEGEESSSVSEREENRAAVSTDITKYTYDTAGNRTGINRNGSATVYTYNGLDQLTSAASSGKRNETKSYIYDEAGNQIKVTVTEGGIDGNQVVENYTYDTRNQLTKVTRDDGNGEQTIQENCYNGNGQRISRKEGNRSTEYFYQNGSVLKTADGTGALQALYLYGAEGSPIGMIDGSSSAASGSDGEKELASYLYTKDMQGSIVNLVDETGTGVTTYTYDDYGNTAVTGKRDTANELAYTGGVYDKATETYYLNARFYRPEDGRFLSMDTYRGDSKEYATWNLYGYCGGDPVNYVDPSGHARSTSRNRFLISLLYETRKYKRNVSDKQIIHNYDYNQRFSDQYKGKYIAGQHVFSAGIMRYGKKRVYSTGCGPIAFYNMLHYRKKNVAINKVIALCEATGALCSSGGTANNKIMTVLSFWKIKAKRTNNLRTAINTSRKKGQFLIRYSGDRMNRTSHIVFAASDGKKLKAWNDREDSKKVSTYHDIFDFTDMLYFGEMYQLK